MFYNFGNTHFVLHCVVIYCYINHLNRRLETLLKHISHAYKTSEVPKVMLLFIYLPKNTKFLTIQLSFIVNACITTDTHDKHIG